MKRIIVTAICGVLTASAVTWFKAQETPLPESETAQAQNLKRQVQTLRQAAGLTPLRGPGIVLQLQDNPRARQNSQSAFMAGLVHDYDLLEAVNPLRVAHAEAIAINGMRVSTYTAIRCEGAVLYVGEHAISHPYKIEAIGNPENLQRYIELEGGLSQHLRESSRLIIRCSRANQLQLRGVTETPSFHYAKAQ